VTTKDLPLVVGYNDFKPLLGIDYSRTEIDRKEEEDEDFPKSFSLSKKARSRRKWWTSELVAWLIKKAGRPPAGAASLAPGAQHPVS